MSCNPGIVYMLVSLLLFAVALVIHFHSSHLSLPIANALTIITAILPIASFVNAFVYPNLLAEVSSPNRLQRMSPVVLQGLQVVLTAVLATLYAEGFVPSPALECVLEDVWARLYGSQDGLSIKYIQDTLNCCGLNTVNDRAYPLGGTSPNTCAELYERSAACRGPWESAMQLHSGINFGVVVVVAIMQIIGLLMMQRGTNWWTTMRDELEVSQPLLTGQDVESGRVAGTSYGSAESEGQQEGTSTPVER